MRRRNVEVSKRRKIFFETGLADCKKHGIHNQWKTRIHDKGWIVFECRLCRNEYGRARRAEDPLREKFESARARAARYEREFDLDMNFVRFMLEKQNNRCALSDIPFETKGRFAFSIDRIDSSKGYTKDNVQLVLEIINRMKLDTPNELFIALCNAIGNNKTNVIADHDK